MPFSYVVHNDHRLVVSTGTDRVTWKEIKARQDQAQADPGFNPEFNQIVDLRAVTSFDMTSDHVSALARRNGLLFYIQTRFCRSQSRHLWCRTNVGDPI